MKPFLILQSRPEDEASDGEYEAFLRAGGISEIETYRIRMEQGDLPSLTLSDFSGVVVGGGPHCVSDSDKSLVQITFEAWLNSLLEEIFELDFPYLGACYGIGILARFLGGEVTKDKYSEGLGAVMVRLSDEGQDDPLFQDFPVEFKAFGGHKEASQDTPPGAIVLASSETCPVQTIRVKKNIYATQFHPELDSAGLVLRINTYRYAGYFPPQEGDQLIALAAKEKVTEPEKFFRNFIDRYKQPA